MPDVLTLTATVLRAPTTLLDHADHPDRLAHLVPRLVGITIVGAMVFGVVVGSYRGGVQLLFAGVKTPLLLLVPVVVGMPAVRALYAATDRSVSWARVALAGLVGAARTAVLAAALGPVLWLIYSVRLDYHLAVLLLALCLVLVGLPGLSVVARALPARGRRRWMAMAGSVLVVGALLAQTGWLLRPFVARPRAEVTFLRAVEEDVLSSLRATAHSAAGDYRGWEAESSGLFGQGLAGEQPSDELAEGWDTGQQGGGR